MTKKMKNRMVTKFPLKVLKAKAKNKHEFILPEYKVNFADLEHIEFELRMTGIDLGLVDNKIIRKRVKHALETISRIYKSNEIKK